MKTVLAEDIFSYTPELHISFCPIFVHKLFPVFEPHIQKWVIFVRRRPCVCDTFSFEKRSILASTPSSFSPRTTTIELPGQKQYSPCFLRRRHRPKAGDAFTRTRLMASFGVSTALSVKHCRPQAGHVRQKGRLKVQRWVFRVFRVFSVGF